MDESTFSQRSMACAGKLYRLSFLILRNQADCEDAVQEALIRAWIHRRKLRDAELFERWLVRILVNESKRILKKRGDRPATPIPDNLPEASAPSYRALWEALGALPDKYRAAMLLHHMEGYSAPQVSKILKLPLSTVKWRLHEGKKRLITLLGEEVVP